jgi:chromosome partitioning protein
MQKIIAIVNQKGGVGKTTTAINLATALVAIGKKILLIDLDPQGNASTGLGVAQTEREKTSYELFTRELSASKLIRSTSIPSLDIIPATVDLSGAELEIVGRLERESILKYKLADLKDSYDYIFIDCPPALSVLTINALVASNSVIVPLQCEFFALEGLTHLLNTIRLIQRKLNPDLRMEGVLLTMYDRRYNLTGQVEDDVRSHLGESVFRTVIPRNVRISEAPSHGQPAIIYDHRCVGSLAYIDLAKEILEREK